MGNITGSWTVTSYYSDGTATSQTYTNFSGVLGAVAGVWEANAASDLNTNLHTNLQVNVPNHSANWTLGVFSATVVEGDVSSTTYGTGSMTGGNRSGQAGLNGSMSVDGFGQQFIKENEGGFYPRRYDSNGRGDWTIGYGHAIRGREHQMYDKAVLTPAEGEVLFQIYLNVAETAVRDNMEYTLNQNEFDALSDLAFNIGGNAFARSYTVSLLNSYSNFGDLMYAEAE